MTSKLFAIEILVLDRDNEPEFMRQGHYDLFNKQQKRKHVITGQRDLFSYPSSRTLPLRSFFPHPSPTPERILPGNHLQRRLGSLDRSALFSLHRAQWLQFHREEE